MAIELVPEETAFVGDMTHDVETARHGGVSSIAVLTGYNHAEILAAVRPDITVPDLGVLRTLLDRRRSVSRPIATVGALIHDGHGHRSEENRPGEISTTARRSSFGARGNDSQSRHRRKRSHSADARHGDKGYDAAD